MKLSKLKLLRIEPIEVKEFRFNEKTLKEEEMTIYSVRHITMKDIDNISEELYQKYLNILLFDKSDIYEEDFSNDITEFEITITNIIYNEEFKDNVLSALSFFLNESVNFFYNNEYVFLYIGKPEDGRYISKEHYFKIREIVKQLNCIDKNTKKKPKAGNKIAEEFMKEMEALKNKYKKVTEDKNVITMGDLVSALVWRGNKSYDDVLNFTVYRLYDGLNQINTIDNYVFTMNGVYAGTIDTSKMKSKFEKLNWIKDQSERNYENTNWIEGQPN
ncbi:hypothetical protein ACR77J_08085 [Tissierella praeacuta]|uniref:hypothetical protein n=1 Tax=Tissierella praeacuta TaxID=43131 RepID=UPI003DA5F8FD